MSHSHGDHSGNANLFTSATLYMQAPEHDAVFGPEPQKFNFVAANFEKLRNVKTVRLNGEVRTHYRTNAMLFDVPTFISTMTRYLTLHPGDVIWMGTDGTSPDLAAGDVVEVELTGIGTLRNPFVLEETT